jgi:hypothetical protein
LGGIVIFRGDAETVDLSRPDRRNKGLKPLAPHDPLRSGLGFRAQRRQALSPLPPRLPALCQHPELLLRHPSKSKPRLGPMGWRMLPIKKPGYTGAVGLGDRPVDDLTLKDL